MTTSVAVIGCGYVGMSVVEACLEAGFKVVGVDNSWAGRDRYQRRRGWEKDRFADRLTWSSPSDSSAGSDIVVIAVPTPNVGVGGGADIGAVTDAFRTGCRLASSDGLVIVESTVPPGTTRMLISEEFGGLNAGGKLLEFAYSPERVSPGDREQLSGSRKIVAGATMGARGRAGEFYQALGCSVIEASSLEAAEAAKCLENTQRLVAISVAYEAVMLGRSVGFDGVEALQLASSKEFGYIGVKPSAGVGGHCIPVDPLFLRSKGGHAMSLVVSAMEVLGRWLDDEVDLVLSTLAKIGNGCRVVVVGATYKTNVADLRNAPGLALGEALVHRGVEVTYFDPLLEGDESGISLVGSIVGGEDLLVVCQLHDCVKAALLASTAPKLDLTFSGEFFSRCVNVV